MTTFEHIPLCSGVCGGQSCPSQDLQAGNRSVLWNSSHFAAPITGLAEPVLVGVATQTWPRLHTFEWQLSLTRPSHFSQGTTLEPLCNTQSCSSQPSLDRRYQISGTMGCNKTLYIHKASKTLLGCFV